MALSISNTLEADLEFIYSLFEDAIIYQRKNGYPDWSDYCKDSLKEDIRLKRQYKIVIDGDIACIFTTCFSDTIVWREEDKNDAIYLHRIVVNKHYKGQRLVGKVIDFTSTLGKKLNRNKIRIDTWANNSSIIDYYKSFNFKIVRHSFNPDVPELPIQMRGNKVVLMEYVRNKTLD
jgi:ribosomal protein S18 acetylase RimI-like enzyme